MIFLNLVVDFYSNQINQNRTVNKNNTSEFAWDFETIKQAAKNGTIKLEANKDGIIKIETKKDGVVKLENNKDGTIIIDPETIRKLKNANSVC
jgi:hypothetical protein